MGACRIIDGDGHIMEDYGSIIQFLPSPYKDRPGLASAGVFPPLDHFHSANLTLVPPERANRGRVGPEEWLAFLDDVGIETTVLYPTWGLACGRIVSRDWAVVATRAYNDWLHETYMKRSPRFQGMGILPMQVPEAAAKELRRVVQELGMCGAMLPATGLKGSLGDPEYWPVFAEADRLGCCLAVHGGCHSGMGFDHSNVFAATHALGHPFGLMIHFAAMLLNGIYDRFPNLKVAFLEGGVAWLALMLERCAGSYKAFTPYDPDGALIQLQDGESVDHYICRQIKAGRMFIGCEGDEPALAYLTRVVGNDPFLYSSDFPHEVTNATCKAEIAALLANEALSQADKEAILSKNAERFYNLSVPVA